MKRSILVTSLAVVVVVAAIGLFVRSRGVGRGGDGDPAAAALRAEAERLGIAPEPLRRVIFIGVDGADWEIIDPLVKQGRLPHFAQIVRDGAAGELRSIEPMLSPLLWTTMATGKLPEEHGILSFTAYDPQTGKRVPISRNYRKVDAFWNMLSDYGRSVDIVGWLATYPAEEIRGAMVTDRVGYLAYAGAGTATTTPGNLSPESRSAEIGAQLVKSTAVEYGDFQRFAPVGEAAFLAARDQAFDIQNPVNNMIMLYASTASYRNIARHLLETDRPDLLAVYFELPDATSHLFMHYAPPRQADTDAAKYELFKNAVEEAYVLQDEIIGQLMALADANTVVMLASDHGFRSGPSRPKMSPEIWAGKAALWHRLEGIVCLYGKGIRAGHRIESATILDIAPTVLALQGLPQPTDMPGKVLVEAFEPALAGQINRAAVTTLQRQRAAPAAAVDDAIAQDALKKLEALGYISRDTHDQHNNLGQRYQKQRQYDKAIAEFEQALAIQPDLPGVLVNLGQCYLSLKRYPEAEKTFQKALALEPNNVYALNNMAVLHIEQSDLPKAREFAEKAVAVEPNYANGHLTLGSIYGSMNAFDKAEKEFRKVLEIEPSNRRAQTNLEKLAAARSATP